MVVMKQSSLFHNTQLTSHLLVIEKIEKSCSLYQPYSFELKLPSKEGDPRIKQHAIDILKKIQLPSNKSRPFISNTAETTHYFKN